MGWLTPATLGIDIFGYLGFSKNEAQLGYADKSASPNPIPSPALH
jgi:hypothetical protein